ncbi:MAG TPA: amidohydrolase family protein [Candidatus Binataceae bacterium]|nr:amidohydrolase family protein [Candidatus Binataceae bacterium]
MRKFIKCGMLFDGLAATAHSDWTIVVEPDGLISFAGATRGAPRPEPADEAIDYSQWFVMPGMIDAHVHLSYGNTQSAEQIDIYSPVEFRALRGLEGAQRMLAAGYTGIADPSTTGQVSLAIRDAIEAGLFTGPRISSAGRAILTAQGVDYFYPRWVKMPEHAVGFLMHNVGEGIAEIRQEIKDGVDFIKIAVDGDQLVAGTGLVSGMTQEEVDALVGEVHRLGRKVAMHARGAEGSRYAARAGVDFILHGSWIDEQGLEWALKNGCALCPTLSLIINTIEFTRPDDPAYAFVPAQQYELEAAVENLSRAKAAGVPFMVGSEAGFAVTPYGEWPARELEYYVKYLGFSPAEALISTTSVNARILRDGQRLGAIEAGRLADVLAIDGNPLKDIAQLQDRSRIKAIRMAGEPVSLALRERPNRTWYETGNRFWEQVYTRDRVTRN